MLPPPTPEAPPPEIPEGFDGICGVGINVIEFDGAIIIQKVCVCVYVYHPEILIERCQSVCRGPLMGIRASCASNRCTWQQVHMDHCACECPVAFQTCSNISPGAQTRDVCAPGNILQKVEVEALMLPHVMHRCSLVVQLPGAAL